MSKSRHTEAQIITALKQVEAGRTVEDVARECGVSAATIYSWKAKYGGLDVSEAQPAAAIRRARSVVTAANQEWALDFAHDVLAAGRNIRVLSVVDAFTRECLALEVDTGFASRRVTRVLDEIIAVRGLSQAIRCDNGPELTSRHFLAWALEWKIELRHIQPGKPTQNAHVESFHGRLREECLQVSWFTNLFDARRKVTNWKTEYNEQRPHSSLGYRAPAEFARVVLTQSYGKDVGSARLENASGVSHFATAPATG
jgi:transposase InsO family protein